MGIRYFFLYFFLCEREIPERVGIGRSEIHQGTGASFKF